MYLKAARARSCSRMVFIISIGTTLVLSCGRRSAFRAAEPASGGAPSTRPYEPGETIAIHKSLSDKQWPQAGNTPQLIVYPAYGGDGHEMFFEIGAYWTDVVEFLKKHL